MKKRVLITGGSGAIGKESVKLLSHLTDRYEVVVLNHNTKRTQKRIAKYVKNMKMVSGDITRAETLEGVTQNLDYVIHLAAIIPPLADEKPELAKKVNYTGTKNLIAALEKNSPNAFFIYASSISVYGDRLHTPEIVVGDPIKESMDDVYAKTKIQCEAFIQKSKLKWTIFRLTGILDPKLNKPDPLMFHMPLDTCFEICTTRDCGRAFVHALEHKNELDGKIFNLAGGERCREKFETFLEKAFEISGLGKLNFPEGAFASQNFHCGYYMDGDELEEILHFRQDSKEDYFRMMGEAIPEWQKVSARLFRPIIKWGMLQTSDPWKAIRQNDAYGLKRYFGLELKDSK